MASTPAEIALEILRGAAAVDAAGLVSAQTHARHVLFEVAEDVSNFPRFAADLDDRATCLAYTILHAGCTLAEADQRAQSIDPLTQAATILQHSHEANPDRHEASDYHLVVAAMAFYAAGHYSRAFVLVRSVEPRTPAAGLVAAFLRKDFNLLLSRINEILLGRGFSDGDVARLLGNIDVEFNAAVAIDRSLTAFTASGLACCLEFIFSGRRELLGQAKEILTDAMALARDAEDPAWWWLARLLCLMLDDLGSSSPWVVLPPICPTKSAEQLHRYLQLLPFLKPAICELWISQRAALPTVLNPQTAGAAVSLRTSGGKTRVAEIAMISALLESPGCKVMYLAPFRSLAFEVEQSFQRVFAPLGYSVSHLYGGSRSSRLDTSLAEEANVIIATPEKLRALLRASPELVAQLKLVVVDEGHLLGLEQRYVRNELFLDHIKMLCRRSGARMLLLSAVLPNIAEISRWITGDAANVGVSDWKPSAERLGLLQWNGKRVRLAWKGPQESFNPSFVIASKPTHGRRRTLFPANKKEAIAATAVRMSTTGPVLIFAGLAVSVPGYAEAAMYALGPEPARHPWPDHEWKIFMTVCEEYYDDSAIEVQAARLGIICHSARLPAEVRLAIERLMAAKAPLIVIATSTLAQGVNLGVSSVIVAAVFINRRFISTRDFWNICGRAGRAFVDTEGKVLYAIDETESPYKVRLSEQRAAAYFDATRIAPVESGLLKLLALLKSSAEKADISFERLVEMAAENDFSALNPEQKDLMEYAFDLIDDELLAVHKDLAESSNDGAATLESVDALFRESLAAIQAGRPGGSMSQDELLALLRARMTASLAQVEDENALQSVIRSGLPLRAAQVVRAHAAEIAAVIGTYSASTKTIADLATVVLYFEALAVKTPYLLAADVKVESRDRLRIPWLSAVPLRTLITTDGHAIRITADFYGYSLPWLIHASGQQARAAGQEDVANELDIVAVLVEVGVPTEPASRVFLAGLRSRQSATEIAKLLGAEIAGMNLTQIRRFLVRPDVRTRLEGTISELTQKWLDILDTNERVARQDPVRSGDFELTVPGHDDTLHVRNHAGERFLCTADYSFTHPVGASEEMPFDLLQNDSRYTFRTSDLGRSTWSLQIRDPHLETR